MKYNLCPLSTAGIRDSGWQKPLLYDLDAQAVESLVVVVLENPHPAPPGRVGCAARFAPTWPLAPLTKGIISLEVQDFAQEEAGAFVLGIGEEFMRRAFLQYLSFVH